MKKKFFLLLTFLLSFVMFIRIGEAAKYNTDNTYVCESDGYKLSVFDNKEEALCCPDGFFAGSHGNTKGCYMPTEKVAGGGRNKDTGDSKCNKIYSGSKYISYGNNYYCFVGKEEPIFEITLKNLDGGDQKVTCRPGDHTGGTCTVLLPVPSNSKNFVGYSKSPNCSNLDYLPGNSEDVLGIPTLYACYNSRDNAGVTSTYGSCSDLFDDDVRGFINDIMNWVRIIVPILLIVFGTLDFAKSIFSGKEDDMKKNRERFIKRIIAAIIVFLIPTLINALLLLANKAWDWMNADTCIR